MLKNKEIKIMFSKVKGEVPKTFLLFKVLFENFNIKTVEDFDEADVIFELAWREGDYKIIDRALRENKKLIFVFAPEDILNKREAFNLIELLVARLTGFWDGNYRKDIKYKIMDKLDAIIPYWFSSLKTFYFAPKYLNLVKEVKENKLKNVHAIIQNDIHGENIFIIPFGIYLYWNDLPKLIKKTDKKFLKKKKFCAFAVTSNSCRDRVKFFKMLSKYKRVDSYGKVLNNMGDCMQKFDYINNPDYFSKYKFVICFENYFSKEYITEKIPNVMLSGSIPIYRGAPDIGKYFNTKSFINYEDYGSYEEMIKKVIELDQNDQLYEKMLKEPWFKDNKIPKIIKDKEKELIKFYKKVFYS